MRTKKMKFLVTGCAGFIGWKVSELLLEHGHIVIGIDNLNSAYDPKLKEWRLDQLKPRPNFIFYQADICDRDRLKEIFRTEEFDAVVNLAARAGVRQSLEDPWGYFETNVRGTLNLLEISRELGRRKFVLASTSSVYGSIAPTDRFHSLGPFQTHNLAAPFREDQPTDRPLSPYAASKKAAETLCYSYHFLYGFDIMVLRYFTVYGPAGRPDMSVFRFIRWIAEGEPVVVYGDGTQKRDFTYVDDIARGTLSALQYLFSPTDRSQPVYEIINLGSDCPVPLKRLVELIGGLLGKEAKIIHKPAHPADVFATWADISRARKLLAWKPQISLEEGLQQSVKWYVQNRCWAKEVNL